MDDTKKEYWFCLIGPVERKDLPNGADYPLRQAVRTKFLDLVGYDDDVCSSGWGLSQEQYDAIRKILNKN